MKTAICFTGTGRSLEYTHENIKKNLIDSVGDCDVFMHVSSNPNAYKIPKYFSIPQVKKIVIDKEPDYDDTEAGVNETLEGSFLAG